jgi:hypothetical protein
MQITPTVTVRRFAKLDPGDLFIYRHSGGSCIAFVVLDPTDGGDRLILPLGPTLPPGMKWPTLQNPTGLTAISFGKDFILRLSAQPGGWSDTSPPADTHAILIADERTYFRANFSRSSDQFQECFVEIATGVIFVSNSRSYGMPPGIAAFATEWEITTTEAEPRVILAQP